MGYALVEEMEEEVSVLTLGVLAPRSRLSLGQRLHEIHEALLRLVAQWAPDEVAVEEPFVSQNVKTAMAIGQAQGVALMAAATHGIDAAQYSPAQVKRAVTGYGGGTKEQVQHSLRMQLDVDLSAIPEDAADALAVAVCHIRTRNLEAVLAQG